MGLREMGNMTQERGKPVQRCVIELVTNVSNWDLTYWGASQEMNRMHFIMPETQKKEACFH